MACPLCNKTTAAAFRPFCSKRCADLDLAKWLNGSYAIPSTDPDDADTLEQALSEALEEAQSDTDEAATQKLH